MVLVVVGNTRKGNPVSEDKILIYSGTKLGRPRSLPLAFEKYVPGNVHRRELGHELAASLSWGEQRPGRGERRKDQRVGLNQK